jgi:predicted nucleic acid-binding protein
VKKSAAPFVDTNVLLYLLSTDADKANRAEALLIDGFTVGVQVLNEFANVARRKLAMPWEEIADVLGLIRQRCVVHSLTVEVHDKAIELAGRYKLQWFDALIVAAALNAGCNWLWSEDMHNGLEVVDATTKLSLTIANPFVQSQPQ